MEIVDDSKDYESFNEEKAIAVQSDVRVDIKHVYFALVG